MSSEYPVHKYMLVHHDIRRVQSAVSTVPENLQFFVARRWPCGLSNAARA